MVWAIPIASLNISQIMNRTNAINCSASSRGGVEWDGGGEKGSSLAIPPRPLGTPLATLRKTKLSQRDPNMILWKIVKKVRVVAWWGLGSCLTKTLKTEKHVLCTYILIDFPLVA